jgi:hypothetical protein
MISWTRKSKRWEEIGTMEVERGGWVGGWVGGVRMSTYALDAATTIGIIHSVDCDTNTLYACCLLFRRLVPDLPASAIAVMAPAA